MGLFHRDKDSLTFQCQWYIIYDDSDERIGESFDALPHTSYDDIPDGTKLRYLVEVKLTYDTKTMKRSLVTSKETDQVVKGDSDEVIERNRVIDQLISSARATTIATARLGGEGFGLGAERFDALVVANPPRSGDFAS